MENMAAQEQQQQQQQQQQQDVIKRCTKVGEEMGRQGWQARRSTYSGGVVSGKAEGRDTVLSSPGTPSPSRGQGSAAARAAPYSRGTTRATPTPGPRRWRRARVWRAPYLQGGYGVRFKRQWPASGAGNCNDWAAWVARDGSVYPVGGKRAIDSLWAGAAGGQGSAPAGDPSSTS